MEAGSGLQRSERGGGGEGGGVMESSRCEPVPAVWTKRCQFGSHGHCWLADTPHKLLLSLLSSWVSISEGQRVGGGAKLGLRKNPKSVSLQFSAVTVKLVLPP